MTRKKITTYLVFLLTITMVFTSSLGAYAESDKESSPEESKLSNPAISLELEREEISYKPGETIEYTIRIKNTGDVVLSELLMEDKLAGEEVIDTLDVGQELLFERSYIIPLDNEEEFIENKATLSVNIGETRLEAEDSFEAYMERMSSTEFLPDDMDDGQPKEDRDTSEGEQTSEDPAIDMSNADELEDGHRPSGKKSYISYGTPMGLMRMTTNTGLEDTIDVNKAAERIRELCRTYEITLDIIGERQNAPVDVVLVIDRSGSMRHGSPQSRLWYAKKAATDFAEIVLGANGIPGSRVALVSFNGPLGSSNGKLEDATIDSDLTDNLQTISGKIANLDYGGGTNTEAGFKQAKNVIQGSVSLQRPNSSKVVIMLTDGLPTASIGRTFGPDSPTQHNAHTKAAYKAGQGIYENNIADVFTIGLLVGMDATTKGLADDILTKAQNRGFYDTPDANELNTIFNEISQNLGYSATNAVVVDKIGDNFDLLDKDNLPQGATYDETTREITWSPGTISEQAQLKYRVRAKPEFQGGDTFTNEYATLTYTDINGNAGKTKPFPRPPVDVPAKLAISLTDATMTLGDSVSLGTGTDSIGENYMSPVTGGDGDGMTYTYEWTIVGDTTGWTSQDKNPTVGPTEDTEYKLIVTDSNGCKAIANMWVRVTEPKVDVTIKKFITGNFGDLSREFDFTVIINENEPIEFKLSHEESKTIEELPAESVLNLSEVSGNYTVTVKVGENEISPNQDGSYTIRLTDEDTTIMVTNNYDVMIDTGVPMDSLPYIIIIAMVVLGLGAVTVRRRRIGKQY